MRGAVKMSVFALDPDTARAHLFPLLEAEFARAKASGRRVQIDVERAVENFGRGAVRVTGGVEIIIRISGG
jgi:hypothetical protein